MSFKANIIKDQHIFSRCLYNLSVFFFISGTSSVARGLSGYIDALIDNKMQNYLRETMPINVNFLGQYPDWLSFFVILLLAALLAFGVKESSYLNNIFTIVNMATIVIVVIAGAIKCKTGKIISY